MEDNNRDLENIIINNEEAALFLKKLFEKMQEENPDLTKAQMAMDCGIATNRTTNPTASFNKLISGAVNIYKDINSIAKGFGITPLDIYFRRILTEEERAILISIAQLTYEEDMIRHGTNEIGYMNYQKIKTYEREISIEYQMSGSFAATIETYNLRDKDELERLKTIVKYYMEFLCKNKIILD